MLLHLNPRLHRILFRVSRPRRFRSSLRHRGLSREALTAKDMRTACKEACSAMSENPTIGNVANLLARSVLVARKDVENEGWLEAHERDLEALDRRLAGRWLVSDTLMENRLVVKVLVGDADGARQLLPKVGSWTNVFRSTLFIDALFRLLASNPQDPDPAATMASILDTITFDHPAFDPLIRQALETALRFGVSYDDRHPLLDPEVFSEFGKMHLAGRSAFDALPNKVRTLISAGQQREPAAPRGSTGPVRILAVSDNWNFFEIPAEDLEAAGFEVRFLDFAQVRNALQDASKASGLHQQLHCLSARPDPADVRDALARSNPVAAALIDWADVVFCEWFAYPAVWMSRYIPPGKKLIARLHSFEAFTDRPFYANLQRFDGLIFIAPHIREIFLALLGDIAPPCPTAVIPNARDLGTFRPLVRGPRARRTLGLTQYASANKDPVFALKILEELLKMDPDWQIRFVGRPWSEDLPVREERYRAEFLEHAARLGDRVMIDGFTRKMPEWYGQIGYILSTSHREGSHESLVEGMLTGALPVLREWPMLSAFGAPVSVFPGLPAFATPGDTAAHIVTAAARFEAASADAVLYAQELIAAADSGAKMQRFVQEVVQTAPAEQSRPAVAVEGV